jgi:flagellar motor protein MotB
MAQIVLAAGVVLLLAGCNSREKVASAAKDDTIRRQEGLLANERADKDALAKQNEALAEQNKTLAEKNGALAQQAVTEAAAANRRIGDLEAIMKEMNQGIVGLKPKAGLEPGQDMGWERDAQGNIRLTVAGTTLFDSGKAELKGSSHSMLANICKTIKSRFPTNSIRVEGHTDATPVVHNKAKYPDNMALSIARSRAVYDYMIKDGGIAANKMYTAGYGEFQPLVHPEKSAADRSKNRRVEIVIMPSSIRVTKEQLADAKPVPASITAKKK